MFDHEWCPPGEPPDALTGTAWDAVVPDGAPGLADPLADLPPREGERWHADPPDELPAADPRRPAERLAQATAAERLTQALATGPGCAAAALLAGLDPRGLLAGDKVRLVQAWESLTAWSQAGQARALAALDTRHPDDEPALVLDPTVTDVEVRAALRLAPGAASSRLDLARDLADRLAPTLTALSAGQISWAHAQVLQDGLAPVRDPALLTRLQRQALRLAAHRTPAATRAGLAKLVLDADPVGARDRHKRARADRHVRVFSLPDGMSCLQVTAPAEQVHAAWLALTHAARCQGADGETIDARRADLALDLLARADATLPAPRRPRILVTVPASTLLGCDDHPALLTGHGWITAEAARRVAADATWQRLLTDPTSGAVLDVGRTTYRPPADLARHVVLRDRTCQAPHCPRPAHQCDLDHVQPYDDGGATSARNLRATCRHDHRARTHGGWTTTTHPDGTTTWTSARGITHDVPPPDPPPATTQQTDGVGPDEPEPPY